MQSSESKPRNVRRPRPAVRLGEGLTRRLTSYALAATAAGVGTLGMPLAADATIIYTRADIPVVPSHNVEFSLTNNSQNIFSIWNGGRYRCVNSMCTQRSTLGTMGLNGKSVLVSQQGAAQLYTGAVIGPSGRFAPGAVMGSFDSGLCWPLRPWHCGGGAYLGVRLEIDGQAHYGWVSLYVGALRTGPPFGYEGDITGYAYQSNPNQAILAGEVPEPGTLGLLALGALGLGLWRRKKAAYPL